LGSNGNTELDLFDRTALVKEHAYNRALGKQSIETMPLINDAVTEGCEQLGRSQSEIGWTIDEPGGRFVQVSELVQATSGEQKL
jgi:hypothetical protein